MFVDTVLGEGNYGECYLGFYPLKAELVVIKKIRCDKKGQNGFVLWKKNYEKEVELLH